ncbi:MAG: hypothetical protein ABIG61_12115 [Planctomycetota bacterium]
MISRKDNLRKVLRGEVPEWVPFSINFAQWYQHHKTFDILPGELKGTADYIDAMKVLQCDIFSRNVDGGVRETEKEGIHSTIEKKKPGGIQYRHIYQTPYGQLQWVFESQEALTTGHVSEYMVKDWSRERDAFLWLMENQDISWDVGAFEQTNNKIDDDGILMVPVGRTPLKFMHTMYGLDGTCFFITDHYKDAKYVADMFWGKVIAAVRQIADHPETEAAILMDNIDTPFYPPVYCRDFWRPYVKEAAEIMHEKGKVLFVHACGKLAGLKGEYVAAEVDGLEGISAPPLGDWPYPEAKKCHPKFIVNGGFSAHEQEAEDRQRLRAYYEDIFEKMRPFDRWIFAASCQTAIHTTWEQIKFVRDMVRELGTIE